MPDDKRIDEMDVHSSTDRARTGASPHDPHGGHDNPETDRRGPSPDPVDELVRAGQGSVPPASRYRDRRSGAS